LHQLLLALPQPYPLHVVPDDIPTSGPVIAAA
jgi:hypothetical protein